jgi:hypothetical protein
MQRRRPTLDNLRATREQAQADAVAAGTAGAAAADGEAAATGGQPPTARQARDQHLRELSEEMRRQVLLKSGKPLPPERGPSPIRTNGRIDMEKMRAMEDALRKRTAEQKKRQHWQKEPAAQKAGPRPAPANPAPTAPAPAAP